MDLLSPIRRLWQRHPLAAILILAAAARLAAALFSKGYATSDDHFLVIEIAQRWLEGFPDWFDRGHAVGHSLVYPGLHYLLFAGLEALGLTDPQGKMLVVRLLHAAWSLPVVWFGMRLAAAMGDKTDLRAAGLLLALFWVLPFMSVRNLQEAVCLPPVMAGLWWAVRGDREGGRRWWLLAGAAFGIAFAFRYQILAMPAGVGLVLLLERRVRPLLLFSAGLLGGAMALQGMVDWIAWGMPFSSFASYVQNNIARRYGFTTGPWYRYLVLVLGVTIPPVSLLLGWGFLRQWRRHALVFAPAALFLLLHALFPNKQERFVLPFLPLFLVLGVTGWRAVAAASPFWRRRPSLQRGLWRWFWIVNTLLLAVVTTTYSRKTRVETLTYLSRQEDLRSIVMETWRTGVPFPPVFYLNRYDVGIFTYPGGAPPDSLLRGIAASPRPMPNYVVFWGERDLERRGARFAATFGVELQFRRRIHPSRIDRLLYRLNPRRNVNQTVNIYRIDGEMRDVNGAGNAVRPASPVVVEQRNGGKNGEEADVDRGAP